jgi:hypothetical protein
MCRARFAAPDSGPRGAADFVAQCRQVARCRPHQALRYDFNCLTGGEILYCEERAVFDE